MTFARSTHRSMLTLSLLLVAALLLAGSPTPAPAAPGAPAATDDEGGTAALRTSLDQASRGYSDAKARLAVSRQRQSALTRQQQITEAKVADLTKDVNALANAAYRGGRLTPFTAAIDSGSMVAFLERSALVDQISTQDRRRLAALVDSRETLAGQRRDIEREVKVQQAQEKAMAKRKADAERALATALRAAAARRVPHTTDEQRAPAGPGRRLHPLHQVLPPGVLR